MICVIKVLAQYANIDILRVSWYNYRMESVNSELNVPSFAKREAYDFGATKESFEIYQELNEISEEIEKWCYLAGASGGAEEPGLYK